MKQKEIEPSSFYRAGQGNWRRFKEVGFSMDVIRARAAIWKDRLSGIEKPWLCWNVDSDWCLVQQKLVRHVGWTPVIGFDPRVGPPRDLLPEAVVVDFNEGLGLPVLYPHFVMEFAFLWAPRLAFWHSDLLVRLPLLESIASEFNALKPGEIFVTKSDQGWRHAFSKRYRRHWELIGCTTMEASKDQFDKGCGWWMGFADHINCPSDEERKRRAGYYWDHGTGIYYWHRRYHGPTKVLSGRAIHEGHCTKIGNSKYRRSVPKDTDDSQRSMASDLARNYDLSEICERMGLDILR